jgi:hypothetical protein
VAVHVVELERDRAQPVGRRGILVAAAGLQPDLPQAIDVGVVQPEDRVQRGGVEGAHPAGVGARHWAQNVVCSDSGGSTSPGLASGSSLRM